MPVMTVPIRARASSILCSGESLLYVLSACRCSFSALCRIRALSELVALLGVFERRTHAGLLERLGEGEGDSSIGRARARAS